jgi:murein DD-endopeptidase MepM/ murein hydrolase activator NlpD
VLRGFDPPRERYGAGHRGVDLAARGGEPVLAGAAGTVSFAGRVAGRGVISIDHGSVRTTYEPVKPDVAAGQRVSAGQRIGQVAAGGHCGGRCLHWGLRRGATYLDPMILVGSGARPAGPLRLLAETQRAVAAEQAQARAAAVAAGVAIGTAIGPPGSHGFLHPVPGAVTSGFGRRFHPVLRVWKLHDGTDFGASCGTPIRAPYSGTVDRRYFNAGYGNRLIIRHGRVAGAVVRTAYNHATRYVVSPGQRVRRGQLIGYVGSTGHSTGCHLHLMVWLNGRLVDPMSWF